MQKFYVGRILYGVTTFHYVFKHGLFEVDNEIKVLVVMRYVMTYEKATKTRS